MCVCFESKLLSQTVLIYLMSAEARTSKKFVLEDIVTIIPCMIFTIFIFIFQGSLSPDNIADVVFLLDTSDEVNSLNFEKEKAFVKLLAKRLNVSPGKSRAALIAFGSSSTLAIRFDSYNSFQAFETLVDRVSSVGGARRIDRAFKDAAQVLKDSQSSVPKIVVLLTTGQQPLDAPSLAESAVPLHSMGAMFYVVSIANNLDRKYFEVLVGDSTKHVSEVAWFDSLNEVLPQMTRGIEEGKPSQVLKFSPSK